MVVTLSGVFVAAGSRSVEPDFLGAMRADVDDADCGVVARGDECGELGAGNTDADD